MYAGSCERDKGLWVNFSRRDYQRGNTGIHSDRSQADAEKKPVLNESVLQPTLWIAWVSDGMGYSFPPFSLHHHHDHE
jgi:hypothetical protein